MNLPYQIWIVVVDDAAALVGLHALGPADSYQSVTGAHGRVAYEAESRAAAAAVAKSFVQNGYRRNDGADFQYDA